MAPQRDPDPKSSSGVVIFDTEATVKSTRKVVLRPSGLIVRMGSRALEASEGHKIIERIVWHFFGANFVFVSLVRGVDLPPPHQRTSSLQLAALQL